MRGVSIRKTNSRERDYYIPPDVSLYADTGKVVPADRSKVLPLSNQHNAHLISFTGMGMPAIDYLTERGPGQHGDTIINFRLQPRTIQYVYRRNECDRQAFWDRRQSLLGLLNPNRSEVNCMSLGRLRKVLPDGTTYDIDALIEQGPAFSGRGEADGWDEWSITETLRFICPDPTWYSPVQESVTWVTETFSGLLFYEAGVTDDHLVFPTTALFASDVISGEASVTYTGTWFAYPTITIVGPISGPTITHKTLDIKIALDYTVPVGSTVTITTDYGNKTITDQLGTNLIGTLSADSDLNFYIAPDPIAADGVNEFSATGASTDEDETEISMTYYPRFIGI
jgi:hypothetical protein